MTELARESRWLAERRTRPVPKPPREFSLESIVAVSLGLGAAGLAMPGPVIEVFLLFFAIAGMGLAWTLGLERRAERQALRYAVARAEFEGDYGRLVSILVRQGDAPTGRDHGVLWFEDGRLYFAGERTSFGLVPGQARGVSRVRERVPGIRNEVELTLRRDTAAGAMSLSFTPILPPHESAYVHRAALRTDLAEWIGGWAEGAGQFPPAAFGPGIIGDRRLLVETLAVTLPLPILLAAFLEAIHSSFGSFAWAFGLFVTTAVVPAGNLRLRALRDRRRLRRAR